MVYLGLPFLKMVDLSMAMLNNQMVSWKNNRNNNGNAFVSTTIMIPMGVSF
jgi:hypothetical protein